MCVCVCVYVCVTRGGSLRLSPFRLFSRSLAFALGNDIYINIYGEIVFNHRLESGPGLFYVYILLCCESL